MTTSSHAMLKTVPITVLRNRVAMGDAVSVAGRAFDELSAVLVPIIGPVGLQALTSRALHLAQRELSADPIIPLRAEASLSDSVQGWLEEQPSVEQAAAAFFPAVGEVLETLVGEDLTLRLFQKAWPESRMMADPIAQTEPASVGRT